MIANEIIDETIKTQSMINCFEKGNRFQIQIVRYTTPYTYTHKTIDIVYYYMCVNAHTQTYLR